MYREHSIREVLTSLENLLQRLCCTIRFLNIIKTCAQGCVMVTAKLSGKNPTLEVHLSIQNKIVSSTFCAQTCRQKKKEKEKTKS